MEQSTDVVIIGGGIIGCSIAYHLSKQGVNVVVLERDEVGSQASGAAAGLFSLLKPLAKMDSYNRLLFASLAIFPSLVSELQEASGIDLEYEQTGTLRTIQHAKRATRLRPWVESCQAAGLDVNLLTEEETRQYEPLLAEDICGAVSLPDEGQVRASRVVEALAMVAAKHGATFSTQREVVGIRHDYHGRVLGVITAQGETLACKHIVVATGAWSARCGEWFNTTLPIRPERGQVLALRQPSSPIRHIVIGKGIYLAPKKDGTLIVGATKEEADFDASVTAGGMLWLLESAIKLVPALEHCTVDRMWAGLRPKTPDNHPIIGSIPEWENVMLAIGHYSFGILLSAITGRTIAEIIVTGQTPEIIRPFTLERFAYPNSLRSPLG